MIQLDDISLAFAGEFLFQNVSFSLQKGERCGLVGRNGSGKSTLLRLITKELEPDSGSVSVSKNYRIGYLQQHIRFSKPSLLEEAALGLPPGEEDQLYKAEKILFGLGFTEEDLAKNPEEFSGGFHLRLHLCKVIISEPDCLLLDEPTNYLDILSIRWLMKFLQRWKGEFLLISHDREFMDAVTTHTMGIHRGKVRKIKGSTIDFFNQILVEEEVREKTRIKIEKKRKHAESYIERFGAKASKAAQAQSRVKMLERVPALEKLNALWELSFSFHETAFPGKKMLEAEELYFSYTQEPLIHNLSFTIEKGERIGVIGKNGRGKSTLLRLIAKDLLPKMGNIESSENLRLGYFGQTHISRLNPDHTIEEEIMQANPKLNFTEIKRIAGIMMFSGDVSKKKISVLSGGEKSRVLLGKILAKPCNLLLLDEPTHHLDIESIEALIDALEDFTGSVVIVTHSELILRRLALNKLLVCEKEKQIPFLGNYDDFLEKLGWEEESGVNSSKKDKEKPAPRPAKPAILKSIEKEIAGCEAKITFLENEQKSDQDLIEKKSQDLEFLRTFGKRQKEIEELYNRLDDLYQSYEEKNRE